MYHSFLIQSSADGHLGCFYVLAIVNSAVMNIGVHVSLSDLISLVCMPRSGIAGPYGSSIFSFLKESPHLELIIFLIKVFSPSLEPLSVDHTLSIHSCILGLSLAHPHFQPGTSSCCFYLLRAQNTICSFHPPLKLLIFNLMLEDS